MASTLIEPQLRALQPPADGDLAGTPLPELLFGHAAACSTGTLHLRDELGGALASVRLEAGAPVAARVGSPEAGLLQSLIPLCARSAGRFAFVQGPDELGVGNQVVRGKVDTLALIAASMRGPVREDAVEAALQRLGSAPLWRNPRLPLERYGFGPQELALVRALDERSLSAIELLADPPCAPHVARRVLYVLSVTRALSTPPRGERQVSGTIARQTPPPPPPLSSRPMRREQPTVVAFRRVEKTPATVQPAVSRSVERAPRSVDGAKRPPGQYHVRGGAEERVAGAEPRAGAPRRALPSALAWRDDLRERARLAPRQTAYELLGVERGCEPAELHAAYTVLVARYAPDTLPDGGEDAARDAAVVLEHARQALDLLGDCATRAEYDRACDSVGGASPPARVVRGLHAEAYYHRAEALWRRRDFVGAQHAVERALALDGTCARYEALLGLLLHLRSGGGEGGRVHPNALRHLETALHLDPRCEQANFAMALVLKRAGRHDEAYQHFHRVWKLNPGNLEAAREVRLHVMRKRDRPSSGLFGRLLGRPSKPPTR